MIIYKTTCDAYITFSPKIVFMWCQLWHGECSCVRLQMQIKW